MGFLDLFRPKYKHSDRWVRRYYVEELTDQTLLAKIAINDKDENVRNTAVMCLKDQKLLAEIAKNDKHVHVQIKAVEKLSDQAILAEIAKNDKHVHVQIKAVEKLSDQAILAEIAKSDKQADVRKEAVMKLKSQTLLTEIARNDKDENIRIAAMGRSSDPRLGFEYKLALLQEKDWNTRLHAAEEIAKIGPPAKEALKYLIPLINDEVITVEHAAIYAIGEIGDSHPDVIKVLVDYIEKGRDHSDSAKVALGKIGDSKAVKCLINEAIEWNPSAVKALENILSRYLNKIRDDDLEAISSLESGEWRVYHSVAEDEYTKYWVSCEKVSELAKKEIKRRSR